MHDIWPLSDILIFRKQSIAYGGLALLAITLTLLILFWSYVGYCVREWENVGGAVHWDEDPLWGPRKIMLGSLPGIPPSRDPSKLRSAIQRMQKLPVCAQLSISCKHFKRDDYAILVAALKGANFRHITLTEIEYRMDIIARVIRESGAVSFAIVSQDLTAHDVQNLRMQFPQKKIMVYNKWLQPVGRFQYERMASQRQRIFADVGGNLRGAIGLDSP